MFFFPGKVNAGTIMTKASFDGFKFAESMCPIITSVFAKRLNSF